MVNIDDFSPPTVKSLLRLKGKTRGENILLDIRFIRRNYGNEGVGKLEKTLSEIGSPINLAQLKTGDFYPIGWETVCLLAIRKVFGFDEEKIKEMGQDAPKFSIFLKIFMKYFVSLGKIAQEAPRIWREYYTIGDLTVVGVNESGKRVVLRLDNFDVHPINCCNLSGFFQRVLSMVINAKTFCQETKCVFRGESFHQFDITW